MVQKQQELYTAQEILSNRRAAESDGRETTGVINGTGDTESKNIMSFLTFLRYQGNMKCCKKGNLDPPAIRASQELKNFILFYLIIFKNVIKLFLLIRCCYLL